MNFACPLFAYDLKPNLFILFVAKFHPKKSKKLTFSCCNCESKFFAKSTNLSQNPIFRHFWTVFDRDT